MASGLHIAIKPEILFHLGGVPISNTLFTSFLVTIALVSFLIYARSQFKTEGKLSRLQMMMEMIVESLVGIVEPIAGHLTWTFMPLIAGFFVFIALNNWSEQIPGFHTILLNGTASFRLVDVPSFLKPAPAFAAESPAKEELPAAEPEHEAVALFRGANADLNMTLALALITVVATQYYGFRFAHLGYLKKFFNFSNPINTFIGLLELIGEFSKILSFSFRLFGNVFAGEVLIAVMTFLVPVILPMPFIAFEVFIGGLQAYVFAMLSVVFYSMAAAGHGES